ncbi:hypothetical protein [Planotetraspora phitsanulokensis]|uniref:hypothetical protein n=1 Tax=Planotetraspora phitsanulokensis TaxID=575192 RepID=UPI0019526285|nr:hypothetical protein [Planotetraspora phitsanulokensis]
MHEVLAYVTNFNSNTVSVINTAADTVIATIPVGGAPIRVAAGLVGALPRPPQSRSVNGPRVRPPAPSRPAAPPKARTQSVSR